MAKVKKGDTLVCVPCGREVSIGYAGIAETAVWCCGKPMKKKGKAKSAKKVEKKTK